MVMSRRPDYRLRSVTTDNAESGRRGSAWSAPAASCASSSERSSDSSARRPSQRVAACSYFGESSAAYRASRPSASRRERGSPLREVVDVHRQRVDCNRIVPRHEVGFEQVLNRDILQICDLELITRLSRSGRRANCEVRHKRHAPSIHSGPERA